MALGNTNQQSNRKLLILKLKSKDENDVSLVPNMFQISEKVGDKWTPRPELEARVSGNLTKVELGEGEWNKKKYGTVKLFLEDAATDELYLLDLRYNSLYGRLRLRNLKEINPRFTLPCDNETRRRARLAVSRH